MTPSFTLYVQNVRGPGKPKLDVPLVKEQENASCAREKVAGGTFKVADGLVRIAKDVAAVGTVIQQGRNRLNARRAQAKAGCSRSN